MSRAAAVGVSTWAGPGDPPAAAQTRRGAAALGRERSGSEIVPKTMEGSISITRWCRIACPDVLYNMKQYHIFLIVNGSVKAPSILFGTRSPFSQARHWSKSNHSFCKK
jgi:hypothetical protein